MKSKIDINKLLNKPLLLWEKFHIKTKNKHTTKNILDNKIDVPESWKTIYYKSYIRFRKFKLPDPKLLNIGLKDVIEKRGSVRWYSNRPLSLKNISTILYYSSGIKKMTSLPFKNRYYPSAGARYPLEIYIISTNTSIPIGVYHYNVKSNYLEQLFKLDKFDATPYFLDQTWINKAGCIILVTAIFKRTTDKYGERGYRNILIESGHVGQNIYLICEALNIGCCAITGFDDDKLNKLLDIDGLNESVIYAFALGNRK